MKTLENTFTKMISRSQAQAASKKEEDFIGEGGLLYCGVCRQPKGKRIEFAGKQFTVSVMCRCRAAEVKRREEEDKRQAEMIKIQRLYSVSLLSAKFKAASFETYEQTKSNEKAYHIARKYVRNFNEMYAKNQGLLFYGSVGTGKSWAAACIANALLKQGIAVVMTSLNEILKKISGGNQSEENLMNELNHARLLILDDLGAERDTSFAMEKVYNVIDSRIRSNKPLILTTNLTFEELTTPPDIRYKRVYDRVLEICYPVCMSGSSFRVETARKRSADMSAFFAADDES